MARRGGRAATTLGAVLCAAMLALALLGPRLVEARGGALGAPPNTWPSAAHWLGTDRFGHDILDRTAYGARAALVNAVVAALTAAAIGATIGAVSGYAGGLADALVQRLVDAALAFPPLLVVLIAGRLVPQAPLWIAVVIGVAMAPGASRVVRAAAIGERLHPHIEATRSLGATDARILARHVLPALVPLAFVIGTNLFAAALLAEASLAFLGLGAGGEAGSWGRDIAAARAAFPVHPPAILAPGVAVALTVLGFNLLGDALGDRLRRGV